MLDYIHHNGSICNAADAYENGAFRYGYGLFETMLVQDGDIRLWPYHAERLTQGAEVLGLWHEPASQLGQYALDLAVRNGVAHSCRLRLQLYGGGGQYGLQGDGGYLISCHTAPPEAGTVTAGIAHGLVKPVDMLANLKTTSALVYAMAASQARANSWDDALVCNQHGNIAESTTANIFWVEGGQVYTPPLTEGCVAGVRRRWLLEEMPGIKQEPLPPERLFLADEVFLTNALRIRLVTRVGDITYGTSMGNGIRAAILL